MLKFSETLQQITIELRALQKAIEKSRDARTLRDWLSGKWVKTSMQVDSMFRIMSKSFSFSRVLKLLTNLTFDEIVVVHAAVRVRIL